MDLFTYQILLTEQCQLRCSYCYMNKRNDMNLEDVSKVIETLETHRQKHNIKKFKVSYFGGEGTSNLFTSNPIITLL